jgi:mRNA interferase MazF
MGKDWKKMTINPKRGEIWQVNLEPTIGQEIKKSRPVVVISSDLFATIDLRVIIPITGWQDKFSQRPFMVKITKDGLNGLDKDSAGNVLQVRSISTQRFMYQRGIIVENIMQELLAGLITTIDYLSRN